MANIHVGFIDQRSCNRILKPPGGGTSNIFGTEAIPDIIPQSSPRRESKQAGTIQNILQTETVTTVSTNGGTAVEQVCKLESSRNLSTNEENNIEEAIPIVTEIVQQQNGNSAPDVTLEVTSKVEQLRVEERTTKTEVSETDSSGNTNIISSNTSSEGSVEKSSSCKKGSSIEDVLKQDDIIEKKKIKGQVHRVPPGGYSSGLW